MALPWIFGIDGGGTSARLRVEGLGGGLLFYGEGGSTNIRSNSRVLVRSNLGELFTRALREAGLSPRDCLAGFAGSAGVDRPGDRLPFAALVGEALAGAAPGGLPAGGLPAGFARPGASGLPERPLIAAGNDAEPALAGAIGDIEGLLLIAGTGSIAYGRTRGGLSARAGGWGHLLGDEGSAFTIAFEALKRGMRSYEGRDLPTGLLDAALGFFGLAEAADLVPLVYEGLDKTRVARFARVVGEYRDRGDALALAIFEEAAAELAALVASVDDRVGAGMARKRLAFRGGLIEGDAVLREAVAARIAALGRGIELVPAAADAATGACILARSLLTT
jgi:N-acetylglucosamine kinase-like BadF-type ATPase